MEYWSIGVLGYWVLTLGFTQFVSGKKPSLDGLNDTGWKPMLHCSSERRATTRGLAEKPSPRRRDGAKLHRLPACNLLALSSDVFQVSRGGDVEWSYLGRKKTLFGTSFRTEVRPEFLLHPRSSAYLSCDNTPIPQYPNTSDSPWYFQARWENGRVTLKDVDEQPRPRQRCAERCAVVDRAFMNWRSSQRGARR
jgi:hypothetical protein